MSEQTQKVELYSATLPPEVQAIVRRLTAKNGKEFRTREFATIADRRYTAWREAWINPLKNTWKVEEFRQEPDVMGAPGQSVLHNVTLLENVCLFDALSACAKFESTAEGFGQIATGQTIADLGDSHFKAFGDREGIPLDQVGMPLPVGFGRILQEGKFSREAKEIATRAQDNLSEDTGTKILSHFPVPAITPDAACNTPGVILQRMEAHRALAENDARFSQRLKRTETNLVALKNSFAFAQKHGFKSATNDLVGYPAAAAVFSGIPASVTAAFWTAAHYATANGFLEVIYGTGASIGGIVSFLSICAVLIALKEEKGDMALPRRRFAKQLQIFAKDVEEIPEGALKAQGLRLINEATLTFHLLWLRQAARNMQDKDSSKFFSRRDLSKAMKAFQTLCRKQGMEEWKIQGLLESLTESPEDKTEEDKIAATLDENIEALQGFLQNVASKNKEEGLRLLTKGPAALEYKSG